MAKFTTLQQERERSTSYETEDDAEEEEQDQLEDESDDDNPFEFKIRGAVLPPTADNCKMQELYRMIHEGMIDLCPPYQREPVWPAAKQTKLIDSIFRNFYIPPLVFAVKYSEELEGNIWVCVDGKQRLTSIMRFMDGSIPHKDPKTGKSWYYTTPDIPNSRGRLQIPLPFKESFDNRSLICVQYQDLTSTNERQIFQRVQLGVALQAGEKLKAISSPRAEWIGLLVQQYIEIEGGLQEAITFDTTRGRDFQNLASMVYCCEGIRGNEERFPSAVTLENWLTAEDAPTKQFKREINGVLDDLLAIASDSRYNKDLASLQKAKRFAPVEFVFIGVLLFQLVNESRASMAKAVHQMVSTIRKDYIDVRMNSKVCKTLWKYVDQLSKNPEKELPGLAGSSKKKPSTGNKKRRIDEDEDEETIGASSHARPKKAAKKSAGRT
ncbi:hypothetical protein CC1G_00364 [Coprinopsis cinerea okayama7|uniref:GmrSD restriction endonucleases N-terminal domain-containing protein n=1 Tax=Coprinopsis cinerea (strain Okayama-7 / 130 / ATCC MYA-4618 / FGSC 9003) TaxID=240176 RepID=A8NXP5_COPC7|nr:hypothetical protein CC1G_00364 [Coprinopsis cinerea okayama7\|eukprot:XP_001837228.2 hypothetical protein CC1G_00364 [Coprinopsis cinerea okayama7\